MPSCLRQARGHALCQRAVDLDADEIDLGTLHQIWAAAPPALRYFMKARLCTQGLCRWVVTISPPILRGLNVALPIAERIKTLYGSALASSDSEQDQFELPTSDGEAQMLPRSALTKLFARVWKKPSK